jgi:TRAP-type C4-dicarboxylate transport system substrate-binding protein
MNKKLWDEFSAEEQGMLKAAMKKSMDWEWSFQPDAAKEAEKKLRTLMQTNDLTPAERAEFVKATSPVYEKFEATIGKDILGEAIKIMGPVA